MSPSLNGPVASAVRVLSTTITPIVPTTIRGQRSLSRSGFTTRSKLNGSPAFVLIGWRRQPLTAAGAYARIFHVPALRTRASRVPLTRTVLSRSYHGTCFPFLEDILLGSACFRTGFSDASCCFVLQHTAVFYFCRSSALRHATVYEKCRMRRRRSRYSVNGPTSWDSCMCLGVRVRRPSHAPYKSSLVRG